MQELGTVRTSSASLLLWDLEWNGLFCLLLGSFANRFFWKEKKKLLETIVADKTSDKSFEAMHLEQAMEQLQWTTDYYLFLFQACLNNVIV